MGTQKQANFNNPFKSISLYIPTTKWESLSSTRNWDDHVRVINLHQCKGSVKILVIVIDFATPLRSIACLLPFHWPEEAIQPATLHSGREQSSTSATCSVLFHSVLFRSVAFVLTWISVTTGHPLRCASLAFISRHAGSHWRIPAQQPTCRRIFVLQKSKVPPESRRFPLSRWRKQEAPVTTKYS